MSTAKRKISISLDADLVRELSQEDGALTTQVNDAIRHAVERKRRHRLLGALLAELDAAHGPVSPKLIRKYASILR